MNSSNGLPVRNKRARASKNPYWRLFQVITSDHAQCTLCSVIIGTAGGNTSGINRHVQRFHVNAIQELDDAMIEEDTQSQPLHLTLSTPKPSKEPPARLLARALATGGAPLSLVQNSHFKQFLKQVGSASISEERVKNELLTMAENSRKHSKVLVKDRENLVLVYDKWTVPNSTVAIVTVFLIHVDEKFKKTITFIGCRRVTDGTSKDNVLYEVQACVHSVGLKMEQIARIVSDRQTGGNHVLNNVKHTPCLGLILSRFIASIMTSGFLKDILEKAQQVVDEMNEDPVLKAAFQEAAQKMGIEAKGLRVYSPFKWGFQYLLVKAYLQSSKAIKATEQLKYLMPTDDEKQVGKSIDMLDEIFSVLSQFEQDDSTASSIIPNIVAISKHLENHQYRYTCLGQFIRAQFQNQTSALIDDEELQLLCFADPRFAFFQGAMGSASWENVENRFIERYEDVVTEITAGSQQSNEGTPAKRARASALESFMNQNTEGVVGGSQIKNEVAKYRYHIQLIGRPSAQEDPLEFWSQNQAKFVHLSNVCKNLLAVPGSGASSGKAFSSSGQLACHLQLNETSKKTMNSMLMVNARSKLAKMNSKVFVDEEPVEQSSRPAIPSRSVSPPPPAPQQEQEDEFEMEVKQEPVQELLAVVKQEQYLD